MPAEHSTELLIVALSARALAQSARLGGFTPRVLDGFADLDTRALADNWRQVPLRAGGFAAAALLAAADDLDPEQRLPVVCGSGFENRTRLLARLCRRRPLLGNTPATIRSIKQPRRLAALLARLDIPHPEMDETTRVGRVSRASGVTHRAHPTDWLIKRAGASGGAHIRPGNARLRRGDYRQRRVAGQSLSALFLADGRRACLVGCNQTWHDASDPARSYTYGGALSLAPYQVPGAVRAALPGILDRLVEASGLVGLCGVDLIVDARHWWLIEINPRPPATMELHEPDTGLLALHLDAVRGRLPNHPPTSAGCSGHAILYAPRRLHVPEYDWPDWISDRPVPGSLIGAGHPVCTLHASGVAAGSVPILLEQRRRRLLATLSEWI